MVKGLVVDKKGKYTVVLTGDGSFIKITSKEHHKIGYEIEFQRPFRLSGCIMARIASIAAAFMLTLGLSYGVYSYTTPYSYVDFDINPSIELTANIYDIIIRAETFDEAGKKLLEKNRLNFKSLDSGIAALVDSAISEGYLKAQEENAVLLSVDSKDEAKKEQLEKNVGTIAAKVLDESKVESAVISQKIPAQKREEAKELGVSPGKLTLIEKARESNPELTLDELKNDSVKNIIKRINENKKDEKEKDKKALETQKLSTSSNSKKAHEVKKEDKNKGKQDKDDIKKSLNNRDEKKKKEEKQHVKNDRKNKNDSSTKKDKNDKDKDKKSSSKINKEKPDKNNKSSKAIEKSQDKTKKQSTSKADNNKKNSSKTLQENNSKWNIIKLKK